MNSQNGLNGDLSASEPLYQVIFDLLEGRIRKKELADGVNLKEGSLCTVLGLSRAPVRRALELLCEKGLIRPANGQGYLVGNASELKRLSISQLEAILSDQAVNEVERSTAWERIYDRVRKDVTECLPFGTYWISEAIVCSHFSVSRTVVREVLSRLMDRELIEKDRRSHWIAGPLTARDIHESFELRWLLEPEALAQTAPFISQSVLKEMRARISAMEANFESALPTQIEDLENDLHRKLISGAKNKRMLDIVLQSQLTFVVPELFRRHFGLKSDRAVIEEHGVILDQLIKGAIDVACSALESHLRLSERSTLAKLRVLSILPKPKTPPYLISVH